MTGIIFPMSGSVFRMIFFTGEVQPVAELFPNELFFLPNGIPIFPNGI